MSNMFLDALAAPPPRRGTAPAGSYPYRRDPQTGLSTAQPASKPTPEAAKDPAAMLASALELVKAAGYRVNKPRAVKATARPTLNCLGLPMSPNYDPNWKRKTPLTSISRLYAPQNFAFVVCDANGNAKCAR
jgi:hypothetical protein